MPGVAPAEVAILGGGIVGTNAAKVAAGLGANVRILDINLDRLRYLDDIMPPNVTTLYSDRHTIRESIERADLVIGAVLITGARAPRLVRTRRPGDDEARRGHRRRGHRPGRLRRDQPARPPTATRPIVVDGVVHYCVTNMPGAVGRTSTYALCNVTLPYVLQLANKGWRAVAAREPGRGRGREHRSRAASPTGPSPRPSACPTARWTSLPAPAGPSPVTSDRLTPRRSGLDRAASAGRTYLFRSLNRFHGDPRR